MAEKKESKGYKSKAKGLRIGAVILWLVAIGFEVLAIYMLNISKETELIIALVLDAVACITGSLLWKRANRLNPSKTTNKFAKFLWDQMGVIACLIAFIPLGIILLRSTDKLDPKMKNIILAIAAVLFVGSVGASIDYNPVEPGDSQNLESIIKSEYSEDEYDVDENGNIIVYWTQYGKSFHIDENCFHIADSSTKTSGTLEEAIAAGKKDPCDSCLERIKDVNKEEIEEFAGDLPLVGETEDAGEENTDETTEEDDAA